MGLCSCSGALLLNVLTITHATCTIILLRSFRLDKSQSKSHVEWLSYNAFGLQSLWAYEYIDCSSTVLDALLSVMSTCKFKKQNCKHSDWSMHFVLSLKILPAYVTQQCRDRLRGEQKPPFFPSIMNWQKLTNHLSSEFFNAVWWGGRWLALCCNFFSPLFEFYGSTLLRTQEHLQAQKRLQKINLTSSPNCSAM